MNYSGSKKSGRDVRGDYYSGDQARDASQLARERRRSDRSLVSTATQRSRTTPYVTTQPGRSAASPYAGSRQPYSDMVEELRIDSGKIYRDPEDMTSWIGTCPASDQYGMLGDQYTCSPASRQTTNYRRDGQNLDRYMNAANYASYLPELEELDEYRRDRRDRQDVKSSGYTNKSAEVPAVSTDYLRNVVRFPTNGGDRSPSSMKKHAMSRYMSSTEDYAPSYFISNGARPRGPF